jgi:hypothetical protein
MHIGPLTWIMSVTTARPFILATAVFMVSGAGCTRHEEESASVQTPAQVVVPAAATASANTTHAASASTLDIPLRDGARATLNPIHAGVKVALGTDAVTVTYARSRGKAFGVAYMLEPGSLTDRKELLLAIRTRPAMRPQLCLSDAAGNVWTAPAIMDETPGQLRFNLSRLQPDPFQNAGRTLPAAADLSAMRMMTILDISGFMGAAEAECEWIIKRIELSARGGETTSAHGTGEGR